MQARIPVTKAEPGVIYPDDGVRATNPITTPLQVPVAVMGLPNKTSRNIHVNIAEAPPMCVVVNVKAASPVAPNADPLLNPNHPNQKMDVPRIIWVMLEGLLF